MIITDLYDIKITSNKNILKLNETATITVKAIDFNGNNVTNKQVKVTVNKGAFQNGNTVIGKNYTGTTGANGFTITYKATEEGVITFTTSIITSSNTILKNNNLQIVCDHWKKFLLTTTNAYGDVYLYVNENRRQASLHYVYKVNGTNALTSAGSTVTIENGILTDNLSKYLPVRNVYTSAVAPGVSFGLTTVGNITYRVEENRTINTSTHYQVRFNWEFN